MKQQLAGLGFWKVSFGSLYPALRRLEKRELIEALRVTGRRKAYQITAAGSAEFERLLLEDTETFEEDRRFNLRLAFFRYLDPAMRVKTLERRRRRLVEHLGESTRSLRQATARGRDQITATPGR